MNVKAQLLCAWSGPFVFATFVIGLWFIAGYVPPMSPTLTAEDVAAIYRNNTTMIRLGMVFVVAASGFVAAWVAAITVQMQRIEGSRPVLAYTQLGAGAFGILLFLLPALIWTLAAFRPDRDPQLTMAINDFGWLVLVMPFSPAFVQCVAIGIAVLSDKGAQPVFPRWVGFFNIWVAVLFLPGGLVTFFKTGPFAWSGFLAFWVPLGVFGIWFTAMFIVLLAAIKQEAQSTHRMAAKAA